MKVQYVGDRTRTIDARDGAPIVVEPKEIFEVSDELGESLLEQTDRFKPAGSKTKATDGGEESESR